MNLDRVQELFYDYQRGKIGRREFIRLSLLVGGAAAAQALIAACSPGQPVPRPPRGQRPPARYRLPSFRRRPGPLPVSRLRN